MPRWRCCAAGRSARSPRRSLPPLRFPRFKLAAPVAALATARLVFSAGAQVPSLPQPGQPSAAIVPVPPAPVPTGARSWVLMDFGTGQVLAGENIDERVAPASITKVMTSYVAAAEAKNGKIKHDDLVTISERAGSFRASP